MVVNQVPASYLRLEPFVYPGQYETIQSGKSFNGAGSMVRLFHQDHWLLGLLVVVSASGLVKMGRDAVGARLEPKGGLQTYFESLRSASQR